MTSYELFEYRLFEIYFAELDEQIAEFCASKPIQLVSYKYEPDASLFRCCYPNSILKCVGGGVESQVTISTAIVSEIDGYLGEDVQFLGSSLFVYKQFVFHKKYLVGYVGRGVVSAVATSKHFLVLSDDLFLVFAQQNHELLYSVRARRVFPRSPAYLYLTPAYKANQFGVLILCQNGLIYMCSGNWTGDKLAISFYLVCWLQWAKLFKFDTVTQSCYASISNVSAGSQCGLLITYWKNYEQFVYLDFDVAKGLFEVVSWSDALLDMRELRFVNDCKVLIRGTLSRNCTLFEHEYLRALCKTRNTFLAYLFCAFAISYLLLYQRIGKRKIAVSRGKTLQYSRTTGHVVIQLGSSVFKCVRNQRTDFRTQALLDNANVIPGIYQAEMEGYAPAPRSLDMYLSYSFFQRQGTLEERQQLLSSMSSSLTLERYPSCTLFAALGFYAGFLVLFYCTDAYNGAIRSIQYPITGIDYENVSIALEPVSQQAKYYNPFARGDVFNFQELNFVFYLCYDCTESFCSEGLLQYIFHQNEVTLQTISKRGVKMLTLKLNSPARHLKEFVCRGQMADYRAYFAAHCKRYSIYCTLLPIDEVSEAYIYQKTPEICYLYQQLLNPESPMFLECSVVEALLAEESALENVLAVFQGIRYLADYTLYITFYYEIIKVIDVLSNRLLNDMATTAPYPYILQALLIIDEFLVYLQLLAVFSARCADVEAFVDSLTRKQQQFLTGEQYESVYGRTFSVYLLRTLFYRYEKSAIFPNATLGDGVVDIDSSTFRTITLPSANEYFSYLRLLLAAASQVFGFKFKIMRILYFNYQIVDLCERKRVRDVLEFRESYVLAEQSLPYQRFFKVLEKYYYGQTTAVDAYYRALQDIIELFIGYATNYSNVEASTSAYKYSLVVLLEQLYADPGSDYCRHIEWTKEYLQFLIVTGGFQTYEQYSQLPDLQKLAVFVIDNECDPETVPKLLLSSCFAGDMFYQFFERWKGKIGNWQYFDEFWIHYLENYAHVPNFANTCAFLYENMPAHYSDKSRALYERLGEHVSVDSLCYLFLNNKQPFARSVLQEDNIVQLASSLIEHDNDKMLAFVLSEHSSYLDSHFTTLIALALALAANAVLSLFQRYYPVVYCYTAIANGKSTGNSQLFRMQQFLSEHLGPYDCCTILCEFAVLTMHFTAEQLYTAFIKQQVPLFLVYQNASVYKTIGGVLTRLASIYDKIAFLNMFSEVSNVEKLRYLLQNCHTDESQLFSLSKDYVNDSQFIFASYEEIIVSDVFQQLCAVFDGYQLKYNYRIAKYLFWQRNFGITQVYRYEYQYFVPKFALSDAIRFVDYHFDSLPTYGVYNRFQGTVPRKLRFYWVVENISDEASVYRAKLLFLLYLCGADLTGELIDRSDAELMELLFDFSLCERRDKRVYVFVVANLPVGAMISRIDAREELNCYLIEHFYRKMLPEEYLADLYRRHGFECGISSLCGSTLLKSGVLEKGLSESEMVERLRSMSELGKSVDVLGFIYEMIEGGRFTESILRYLIVGPIYDSKENKCLPAYLTGQKQENGWYDTSSSDSSSFEPSGSYGNYWESETDDSVCIPQEENPGAAAGEKEEIAAYCGRYRNKYFTNETQLFLLQHADFTGISAEEIGQCKVLSLSAKLYLLQRKASESIISLEQTVVWHLCEHFGVIESNALEKAFDLVQMFDECGGASILQLFDPYIVVPGGERSFSVPRVMELYIRQWNLLQYLTQQSAALFELFKRYQYLYVFRQVDVFHQLVLPSKLTQPCIQQALKKMLSSELDVLFVQNGGCEILDSQLLDAYFLGEDRPQEPFELTQLKRPSFSQQIKLAFALSRRQVDEFFSSCVDEMQSFSYEPFQSMAVQLHQLNKLPSRSRDRIAAELLFIAQCNESVQTDGSFMYCSVPYQGEVAVALDFLAFSDAFATIKGDLAVPQYKARVADQEITIEAVLGQKQRRRTVRMRK